MIVTWRYDGSWHYFIEIKQFLPSFHCRLFYDTCHMYSFSFASMFFWNVINLASCAFVFEKVLKLSYLLNPCFQYLKNNFFFAQELTRLDIDLFMVLIIAMTNVFWLYFHCLLGKVLTDWFNQLPNHLFYSKWYKSTNELQKFFILMIQNAQQPLFFEGLGIYTLNLQSFSHVSRVERTI